MGGMARAWRQRQWQHRDRNATRKGIPANTDCRGGVFATRRFPRPPDTMRCASHSPVRLLPMRPTFFTTTRHAASLRPPRNGRIGLNRRIPKGAAAKGRPPPGTRPSHSTSVIKTWFSMGGMARAWRQRQWQHRDRNATRKGIPANTDCRGGVFATRRFPRPPPTRLPP